MSDRRNDTNKIESDYIFTVRVTLTVKSELSNSFYVILT